MKPIEFKLSTARLIQDFKDNVQKLSGLVFTIDSLDEALILLGDDIDPVDWADFKRSLRVINHSLFHGDDGQRH